LNALQTVCEGHHINKMHVKKKSMKSVGKSNFWLQQRATSERERVWYVNRSKKHLEIESKQI
jgi:hypothetical protein